MTLFPKKLWQLSPTGKQGEGKGYQNGQYQDFNLMWAESQEKDGQIERWYFHPDSPCPLSDDDRRWMVNRQNILCPFYKYIGNPKAVERLSIAAFAALGRYNHNASDQCFSLIGPASTGKTTLARLYAEVLDLPFVELNASSLKDANEILVSIARVLENTRVSGPNGYANLSLNLGTSEDNPNLPVHFKIPPCVVFIDEIHALPKPIMNAMLKATERNDGILMTGKYVVDCELICFIIATTHRGKLFGPFDSRFNKIQLDLYTKEEIAEIISKNQDSWDMETCRLVAKYNTNVPREALAFGREMLSVQPMLNCTWAEAAAKVAEINGIDEFGLTEQRREIITILGQNGPVSKARMTMMLNMSDDIDALDKFILPPLMISTKDQPALVSSCSRGLIITPAGLKALTMRGIKHLGNKAIPEVFAMASEEDLEGMKDD